MKTQNQRIFEVLKRNKGKWIDAMIFIHANPPILRYASRICELRQQGHTIETRRKEGRTWAEYRLVKEAK